MTYEITDMIMDDRYELMYPDLVLPEPSVKEMEQVERILQESRAKQKKDAATYEITDMIMDDRYELEHPDLEPIKVTPEHEAAFDKIFEEWLRENKESIKNE